MPLPEVSVSREPMHTRAVRIEAFRRSDGAWDLEAELSDTKPFVTPLHSGPRAAGSPIHLMRLRLTIDTSYTVIDVAAVSDAVPYPGVCDSIGSAYRRLIGLNLRQGFRRGLRERLGGIAGCTHLTELAQFFPTAAFQARAGDDRRRGEALERSGAAPAGRDGLDGTLSAPTSPPKPFPLDRCHALRTDGPAVALYYPRWYRPEQAEAAFDEPPVSSKEQS